jgi:hypothetical protein
MAESVMVWYVRMYILKYGTDNLFSTYIHSPNIPNTLRSMIPKVYLPTLQI